MKKLFSLILAVIPLSLLAQGGLFTGSGYYRVQNRDSKRYMGLIDNRAKVDGANVDLGAFRSYLDFDENVVSNPATICFFQVVQGSVTSTSTINLVGQGLDLYTLTEHYLTVATQGDKSYKIASATSGVQVTLCDATNSKAVAEVRTNTKYCYWYILPLNQEEGQYFGVKPEAHATADDSYWSTLYASFPFTPTPGMRVYGISRVIDGYAILSELVGNIATDTPILIRCAASTPAGNKLTLLNTSVPKSASANVLKGNYYCNVDNSDRKWHQNVTPYDPKTMRVLGTTADGRPAFVKSDIENLPANKAYLTVAENAPDEILIINEEDFPVGISEPTASQQQEQVYTLSGLRVSSPAQMSKGIYVVNGKKVIRK